MSGGFLRTIFNGLRQGLNKIVREKAIMVGEDHLGNKYYEVIADKERGIRGRRYVSVPGVSQEHQYAGNLPNVPAEWHAWLRNRRASAPTPEEQAAVLAKIERKREFARLQKESERTLAQQDEGGVQNFQSADQKVKFPVRDDFETIPGEQKAVPDVSGEPRRPV